MNPFAFALRPVGSGAVATGVAYSINAREGSGVHAGVAGS
jgi:hypothetical protein